jgi:hypothetical protein
MSSWHVRIGGKDAPSKKAIKEAVRDDLESVTFECTDLHGRWAGCTHRGDLMPDINGTFCGPNPHKSRKFYGHVKVKDQKVSIS